MAAPLVTAVLMRSAMVAAMPEGCVQPYLDSAMLARLPSRLQFDRPVYGRVARHHHQLSPASEATLAPLSEMLLRRHD